MKKLIKTIAAFVLVSLFLCAGVFAEMTVPSKRIHIFLDDSDNMTEKFEFVQALYAMEIFASMLGEKDELHIYYANNLTQQHEGDCVSFYGKDGPEKNVNKIHTTSFFCNNGSYYENARTAQNELIKHTEFDERWFIYLTNASSTSESIYNSTPVDVEKELNDFITNANDEALSVYYFQIGYDSPMVKENKSIRLYSASRKDSADMPEAICEFSQKVFANNEFEINDSELVLPIAMDEVIVFAQGENVTFNGIKSLSSSSGVVMERIPSIVNVDANGNPISGTEKDVVGLDNLFGYIKTYKNVPKGTYTLDVKDSQTLQIFYKPQVSIKVKLTDGSNSTEVKNGGTIAPGTYKIEYYITDGDGNALSQEAQALLGNVNFKDESVFTNNDDDMGFVASGDTITLEDGRFEAQICGKYLTYGKSVAQFKCNVHEMRDIKMEFEDTAPKYHFKNNEFLNPGETVLKLSVTGREENSFSAAEWNQVKSKLRIKDASGAFEFDIDMSTAGVVRIKPKKIKNLSAEFGNEYEIIAVLENGVNIDGDILSAKEASIKGELDVELAKKLIFTFTELPEYTVDKNGFVNPQSIVVTVTGENGPLDSAYLAMMGLPEVTSGPELDGFNVVNGDTAGVFIVTPKLIDNDPFTIKKSGEVNITVKAAFSAGEDDYFGEASEKVRIICKITAFERFLEWLKKNWQWVAVVAAILFILFGYIPPFKKYLPGKLKKRPLIDCSAQKIGQRDVEAHGKYKRNIVSTIIPYKAETGVITFSPAPCKKSARVRAAGGGGMFVTNLKLFAGKDDITFNGMSVEKDRTKPLRIGANSTISLKTPEYNYTCYLTR